MMQMIISDDCINCYACAVECPTSAIFEPAEKRIINGEIIEPLSYEHFFIAEEICDHCSGLNEIRCIAVCPMDAIKTVEEIWVY
ncbi:MAG: 4Fe-4S binding protein [Ignavibacteriaceae bacterium]|nr:4Fe-4S binding protein [Ignavibacteriaceae bacterium]